MGAKLELFRRSDGTIVADLPTEAEALALIDRVHRKYTWNLEQVQVHDRLFLVEGERLTGRIHGDGERAQQCFEVRDGTLILRTCSGEDDGVSLLADIHGARTERAPLANARIDADASGLMVRPVFGGSLVRLHGRQAADAWAELADHLREEGRKALARIPADVHRVVSEPADPLEETWWGELILIFRSFLSTRD